MYVVEIFNTANESEVNRRDLSVRVASQSAVESTTTSTGVSDGLSSSRLQEAASASEEYNQELNEFSTSRMYWNFTDTAGINDYIKYNAPGININGETLNLVRNSVTKKFSVDSDGYTRADILSITWREADDFRVKRYHENWIALFYDRDRDMYLSSEDPVTDGLYRTIRVKLGNNLAIRFDNVIPKNVAGLSLSWKNNPGIVTHSMDYYIESWSWETDNEGVGL